MNHRREQKARIAAMGDGELADLARGHRGEPLTVEAELAIQEIAARHRRATEEQKAGRTYVERWHDVTATFRIQSTGGVEEKRKDAERLFAEAWDRLTVDVPPGRPGEHRWIAHGLDAYHAVNLREALKLVPDTGDWHGSLRAAIEIVLRDHPEARPNQTAEQMRAAAPSPNVRERELEAKLAIAEDRLAVIREAMKAIE